MTSSSSVRSTSSVSLESPTSFSKSSPFKQAIYKCNSLSLTRDLFSQICKFSLSVLSVFNSLCVFCWALCSASKVTCSILVNSKTYSPPYLVAYLSAYLFEELLKQLPKVCRLWICPHHFFFFFAKYCIFYTRQAKECQFSSAQLCPFKAGQAL